MILTNHKSAVPLVESQDDMPTGYHLDQKLCIELSWRTNIVLKLIKNKSKWILFGFLSFLLGFAMPAQAKTLVLVHGFLSGDMYWRTTGFTKPLEMTGWKDAGSYNFIPQGMLTPSGIALNGNIFITVNLPSQANLQIQEGILMEYLNHLYTVRKEPITLIGHSAGGVVSRLYIIDPAHIPVNALITIASPHLGTPTANAAYIAGNSPLGIMASIAGEEALQDARGLFSDLKEEKPGNFLYWMNHQPHPDIHYASIIRNNKVAKNPKNHDYVVPSASQNMNNIWALKGRSGVAYSNDSHALTGKDGITVLNVLKFVK